MGIVAPVCVKCGAIMDEGFILDNAHGARLQSEWVDGAPERNRWVGVILKGREHERDAAPGLPGL